MPSIAGTASPHSEALPSELFSLTVTSPPYNIGKEYETPMPLDDYLAWCGQWMTEVSRVTGPDGAFWLNVGYVSIPGRAKAVPLPYLLWIGRPSTLIQEVVWNYGAGVAARKSLSPRNEKLLWYVKNPENYTFNLDPIRDPDVKYPHQKKNGKLRCNTIGKEPFGCLADRKGDFRRGSCLSGADPPSCTVSLDLVNRIVLGFSNPGHTGPGSVHGLRDRGRYHACEHGRKIHRD